MKIQRHLKVPTGDILVVEGQNGLLELLSLGDYGKDINIKCDALGLTKDIEKVSHSKMLPLEDKWVITVSTQYGCSMGCNFCDVPKVGPGKNATTKDLIDQIIEGIYVHPEVRYTNRLNIHYARMGEPTWNSNIFPATTHIKEWLGNRYKIHPVVSTMMPRHNRLLRNFITSWMDLKNTFLGGNAGLQLSINSTNENERSEMFSGNACSLEEIAVVMKGIRPKGRKITLNFAIADYEIDPDRLLKYFDPELYIIKLTPMHKTREALRNSIKTKGDYTTFYPYKEYEESLKKVGFDVLVFIASEFEDLSRITCGNAILSGTLPECQYEELV